MKISDSLSHYNYEPCENGYTFTTDSGNRYIISFIDYSTVIPGITCSQIFSFNIDRVDDGNHDNGSENKVRNTILIILRDFFEIYTNAMISVCEMTDGKQEARFRLFSSWEKKFLPSDIKKATASFFVNGIRTFALLYYHANNIDADVLAKGFKALADINFYNE